MDENPKNIAAGESTPSRPGKLTVIALIGLVIAFFAMVLTVDEGEMTGQKRAQAPTTAPTQQVQ